MRRAFSLWIAIAAFAGCVPSMQDPVETPVLMDGPMAPSGLTARPLSGGVHLTWTDNATDERETEIERKTDGADYIKIASVVFDTTQFHDADVAPGSTYIYRVRAMGQRGSSYSNEAAITLAPNVTFDGGVVVTEDAAVDDAAALNDSGVAEDAGLGADAGPPADAGVAVSFQRDIAPIFERSCGTANTMCHARNAYAANADRDCRGWLSLENRALGSTNPSNGADTGCPDRTLYRRLLELDAWMCDPARRYVVPGSLADSQLYGVISGNPSPNGSCNRSAGVPLQSMPPATSFYNIAPADVALIRSWILAGAPNN